MALLKLATRKKIFNQLGLGTYNSANIKKLQKQYFAKDNQVTGKYGPKTDALLRHIYNVKKYTTDFSPEEFKCGCGGKYCTGYPTWMKPAQLDAMQTIRNHYKKPMKITCGLRCPGYNKALSGSVSNSRHLSGAACDYYISGVTDTLENRNKTINYLKTLKNHRYSYGNGIASDGTHPNTPNMGNAMHTDCADNKVVNPQGKIKIVKPIEVTEETEKTNAEKLGTSAKSLAWAFGTPEKKWDYNTGAPTDACKKAMKKLGYDSKIKWSDCGNFMNTVIYQAIGKKVRVIPGDRTKPFTSTAGFKIVFDGTSIKYSQLKKFDIVRYKRVNSNGDIVQHVGMYMGKMKNKDGKSVHVWAEAGRGARFGVMHATSKFIGKRKNIQILRAIES